MTNTKLKRWDVDSSIHGGTDTTEDELGEWVRYEDAHAEIEQLRGNLSLTEEGLANATQEIERLKVRINGYADTNVELRAEIERLNKKCSALALLHYGSNANAVEPGAEQTIPD